MESKRRGSQSPPRTESSSSGDGSVDLLNIPRWQSACLTVSLMLSLFCVSLDTTVLTTAIPKITSDFHSLEDVGWYGSSYLFATCAVQLQFGKVYSLLSTKWVFFWSVAVFEFGSILCGIAPNSAALIAGRSIAGLGAAGITLGSFVVMTMLVPLRSRPMYTSLLTSMHGIACVAGPLLGGFFTDYTSWRWCFYINLPMGAIALGSTMAFMPALSPAEGHKLSWKQIFKQLDPIGTVVLVFAVMSLLLALQWGGSKYAWNSGLIIILFIMFGMLTIIFFVLQKRMGDEATLPLYLVKDRNILGAIWYSACMGGVMTVFSYYLPIWFQAVKGVSATTSGIMNLPMILGLVIVSLVASALTSWVGYYTPFLVLSAIITPIGSGLLSTLQVDSSIGYWLGYQVLMTIGLGIGVQIVLLVSQATVCMKDMPIATTLLLFAQTFAGAIFIPVSQAIFFNTLVSKLHEYAPTLNIGDIIAGGLTGLRDLVPLEYLPSVLAAFNVSLMHAFYVAVILASLSLFGALPLEWISLKNIGDDSERSPLLSSDSEEA